MPEATYQVRVSGVIPDELLGSLPDQSAVVGLISRIHGLGLRLIEVRRLPAQDGPGAGKPF
jgi:hypothetical protein